MWKQLAEAPLTSGLYVAVNVDLCDADLHHCGPHSVCRPTGHASYDCGCEAGYTRAGMGCIPTQSGQLYRPDVMDWLDQPAGKKSIPYVYFPGIDTPGFDLLSADEATALRGQAKIAALQELCDKIAACMGFNTNGFLKYGHLLTPPPLPCRRTPTLHLPLILRCGDWPPYPRTIEPLGSCLSLQTCGIAPATGPLHNLVMTNVSRGLKPG